MTETRRYETCPICCIPGGLPHQAHRKIVCLACSKDLGLAPAHKTTTKLEWWGCCKSHEESDPFLSLDREIQNHNAGVEAADEAAKQAEGHIVPPLAKLLILLIPWAALSAGVLG